MPKWLADDLKEAVKLVKAGDVKKAYDFVEGIRDDLTEKSENMSESFPDRAQAYEQKADEVKEFVERLAEFLPKNAEKPVETKKEIVMIGGRFLRKTTQKGLPPAWANNFQLMGVNFPLVDKDDVDNYMKAKNYTSHVAEGETGPHWWFGAESFHGYGIPKGVDAMNDFAFQAKCITADYQYLVEAAKQQEAKPEVPDTLQSIAEDLENLDDSIDY